ncbi:flagellar biosynthesis regulator FlaF [Pseudooceanicola sp. C21-150M6]|uniref:flagellar biosynthesis regulator FlaF n=1 Tax=Pseudooceanicola sp. C21-150M6 TaxID=3434355 RepID=UPI003D7F70EC
MTAQTLAQRAYRQTAAPTRTARSTEYEVMARVTHRLISAAKQGRRGFPDLCHALHDNRKLWTLLAADVMDKKNKLPSDLRTQIVSLADFTRVHSGKVLRKQANVAPLVEINTAIMRGLTSEKTIQSLPSAVREE